MSGELEKKLEELDRLREQRDEIERRLGELLGLDPEKGVSPTPPLKSGTTPRRWHAARLLW